MKADEAIKKRKVPLDRRRADNRTGSPRGLSLTAVCAKKKKNQRDEKKALLPRKRESEGQGMT